MSKPTLILTRPLLQSQDFLLELSKMLGETPKCIISPLIEIVYLPVNTRSSQPQALLFTSTNGVTAFANVSDDRTPLALCVGPSTFRAAIAAGFQAQNADGTADDLRQLSIQKLDPNLGKIIYVSGRDSAYDVTDSLRKHGFDAERVVFYEQRPMALSRDAKTALSKGPTVAPVFSAKTALTLRSQLPDVIGGSVHCVCISRAVIRSFQGTAVRCSVALLPNRGAMLEAVAKVISC